MIADLLNDNADVDGCVETSGRVECFLEQQVDVPGLSVGGIRCGLERRHFCVATRQISKQLPGGLQCSDFIFDSDVSNTALRMNTGPTELVGRDVFTKDRFYNTRASQPEEGFFRLNQETALSRKVGTATSIKTKHTHN